MCAMELGRFAVMCNDFLYTVVYIYNVLRDIHICRDSVLYNSQSNAVQEYYYVNNYHIRSLYKNYNQSTNFRLSLYCAFEFAKF